MATIDKLQIKISAQTGTALRSIDRLVKRLDKLKVASSKSGLESVYRSLNKISKLDFSNLAPLSNLIAISSIPKMQKQIESLQNTVKRLKAQLEGKPVKAPLEDSIPTLTQLTTRLQMLGGQIRGSTNPAVRRMVALFDKLRAKLIPITSHIKTFGDKLKEIGKKGVESLKNLNKKFTQLLTIVLVYGGAFRAAMLAQQGVSEGLQNIAKYSTETANNMNKLSTEALYLKNSIGAVLYPVVVAITPALMRMSDAIVRALNHINAFIRAMQGETTYIRAKRYLKEYGDEATKTAKKIKQSFAGIDEITTIGSPEDTASSSDIPDYSQMFETIQIAKETTDTVNMIKSNLDSILAIMGIAIAAVGMILVFTGHVPLGVGMIIAGAALLAKSVAIDWNSTNSTVESKLNALMKVIGGAYIVVGVMVCFASPANLPLGLALILLGVAIVASAVALDWEGIPTQIKGIIGLITQILGGALLVIGIIVCLAAPTHLPIGIALIIAGVVLMVSAATVNWQEMPEKIKTTMGDIVTMLGGALAVLGVILIVSGHLPLGLGLLIAGAVMFHVGEVIPNSNGILDLIRRTLNSIIDLFERAVNYIIDLINKISIPVPAWLAEEKGIGDWSPNLKRATIPRLAVGGFPDGEDGLFYANHTELVGRFSNGRTAVANNSQIVEGIRQGVYDAVRAALMESDTDNGEPTPIYIDGDKIGEAVIKYHNNRVKSTGYSPLKIGG